MNRVIRECQICSKDIKVPRNKLLAGRGKYCSKACQNIGNSIRLSLRSQAERFWTKVNKDGPFPENLPRENGQCWVWVAARDKHGYGRFGIKDKVKLSHRVAWETLVGPVPDNLWVLHHCDYPSCVRPDHLFLGTAADNSADMVKKGRVASPPGKNHP